MSYAEALERELVRLRLPRRTRRRILAEIADHLACDPRADLGDPVALAQQFADELGTSLARGAAIATFAALGLAGVLFGIDWVLQSGGALARSVNAATPPVADIGAAGMVIAPQVAFVAGVLALLRALRHRRAGTVPRTEATIIVRRAAVALGGGLASMAALALTAAGLGAQAPGWWVRLSLLSAAVGGVALLAAVPPVLAAVRLRPAAEGPAADLFFDLGRSVPIFLRDRPWRFALAVAGAVALLVAGAGAVGSDPYDGALRGVLDGVACLAGFAVLGRFLGLRR